MTTDTLHTISMARFKSLFPSAPYVGIGDDFFVMDIRFTEEAYAVQFIEGYLGATK